MNQEFSLNFSKGIRDKREDEQETRVIYINNIIPEGMNYAKLNYGKNKITTSKVTQLILMTFFDNDLFSVFK